MSMSKKVFISRDLKEGSIFKSKLEAAGYQVNGKSLININSVEFGEFRKTDWVFFSSKNAVKHFLGKTKIEGGTKLGAIGLGTMNALKEMGYDTDYYGMQSKIEDTARDFGTLAERQSVLFPQAKNSLRSIQKHLVDYVKIHDLVVYKNEPVQDIEVPFADILVFTSPMNARTYLEYYDIEDGQQIVAIGPTTGNTLEIFGVREYKMPENFSEESLAECIL